VDESQTTTLLMGSPCQTALLSATATLGYKTATPHTPLNKCQGTDLESSSSSIFLGGKRHSVRSNVVSSDGVVAADEDTLTLQPSSISIVSIPQKRCISNLSNVGLVLGSNSNTINLSINALKRVKVDRTTVTPNQKETKRLGVGENPFAASDDEDTENGGTLLEHLVKEITDVGLDDLYLDTKICDLMVTGRKSKIAEEKRKSHKKGSQQKVSP